MLEKNILQILESKTDWVTAKELSHTLNVSTKTISNRVKKINQTYGDEVITSSFRGYKINDFNLPSTHVSVTEKRVDRTTSILFKLLSAEYYDYFDLAAEFFISESTLLKEISKINALIRDYKLVIERKNTLIELYGSEANKRKLITQLLFNENYNDYMLSHEVSYLSIQFSSQKLLKEISNILLTYENIYINDYGLSNILLHILVILTRIKEHKTLDAFKFPKNIANTVVLDITTQIKNLLLSSYSVEISRHEFNNLALIISTNISSFDVDTLTRSNMHEYIPSEFINMSKSLLEDVKDKYLLNDFDDDFYLKFTLHIMNLVSRAKNGLHIKNPYIDRVKSTYPLTYDMSLYIVDKLRQIYHIDIVEDEIIFIAFYLGSHILSIRSQERVNVYFVHAEYNNLYHHIIEQLKTSFGGLINIEQISSSLNLSSKLNNFDLIITSTNLATVETSKPIYKVDFFLSDTDQKKLRLIIKDILRSKKKKLIDTKLNLFLNRNLFKRNTYYSDEYDAIKSITNELYDMGLCESTFHDDVVEREQLSSTSFANRVAIPHSFNHNTNHSFLYVIINDNEMKWGKNYVNVIVLIGVSQNDQKDFMDIFDKFVAVLYDINNVKRLINCKDYLEFREVIIELLVEYEDQSF